MARELGLGDAGDPSTTWAPLDFGWNLADVLKKPRDVDEPISAVTDKRPTATSEFILPDESKDILNVSLHLSQDEFVNYSEVTMELLLL